MCIHTEKKMNSTSLKTGDAVKQENSYQVKLCNHISFQPRFEFKAHVVIVNSHFLNQLSHKALVIFCNSGWMCLKECFKFIELLKRTCVRCILKKEFMLIFPDCIYLVKKLIDATSS